MVFGQKQEEGNLKNKTSKVNNTDLELTEKSVENSGSLKKDALDIVES